MERVLLQSAEARHSLVAGNGLFAKKRIPAGEEVLTLTHPLIGVLDVSRSDDACANCFRSATASAFTLSAAEPDINEAEVAEVSACTACKKVKYCSKLCQAQSWKRTHKQECKILKDLPPLPSVVRATLQLALRMNGSPSFCTDKEKRETTRLQHHEINFFSQAEYATTAQASRDIIGKRFPELAGQGLVDTYSGQIWRNSLTLVSETLEPTGLAFDPLLCTANHSCSPNAYIVFVGPLVSLRSLLPIAKDEEIFISYVDTTNPYQIRQAELASRYGFTCQCKKCGIGSQEKDTLSPPAGELANDQEQEFGLLQMRLFDRLEKAQKVRDPEIAITKLQSILDTCAASTMWPIVRQPYPAARNELFANFCTTGNSPAALLHATKTYFLIDPILYPQEAHPIRVVHTWALVKTLMWVYEQNNDPASQHKIGFVDTTNFDFVVPIWRLLKEVYGRVVKSHGQMSRLRHKILQTMEEVRGEISQGGQQYLALIESDPGGHWKLFRSWANLDL